MAITEQTLEDFKKLVRKAIFLDHGEEVYFQSIPNKKWTAIFETNFNGNLSYAQRVILKQFREIKKVDMPRVANETTKITNLERATKIITDAIDSQEPIVYVTDIDNDGSFSQSIIHEYLRVDTEAAKNMIIQFSQTVNGNSSRGITVDLVDKVVEHKQIDTDKPFLLITADNGINSREEQEKIHARYPTAKLIVTDHHIPEEGMCIVENDRAVVFNPHWKPSTFYKKFNISGAATLGVLLRNVLEKRMNDSQLELGKKNLDNITNLSRIANLLDYVNTDPMDKPEKDYVVTKFLQLQGLMNVNNSLNRIILDGIPEITISQLEQKVPGLEGQVLRKEAQNIQSQNVMAKVLLKMYEQNRDDTHLTKEDFGGMFLKELNDTSNFTMGQEINENFIEQLRPLIFCLSVDDEKSAFLDNLNEHMVEVFESIRASEKNLANELRKGKAIQKSSLPYSSIGYADKDVLKVFNRKLLGKVYNDENPGFLAMMDSKGAEKVSGSFRSLYDIKDILPEQEKRNLEFELGIKIETPGHERAAGFIIKSADPDTQPVTDQTIHAVNEFINSQITKIKAEEVNQNEEHLLTDLSAIHLIDRINRAVRGNISNFERITSLLKLNEDTIWTDSYTTEQFSMRDIADKKQFGYISINTDFHGGTVIVPVELVRRIADNQYQDYLSINYMDEGVFMAERVVPAAEAGKIIDLRGKNAKSGDIAAVFSTDLKDKNVIDLTRDQIKDNPFYKYHDYGELDFNLFERMVIGLIDVNHIDILSVFDVEANGFGNGKLMNFGAMNYFIKEQSGEREDLATFNSLLYHNQRGEEFLLTEQQESELVPVSANVKPYLPLQTRRQLLMKRHVDANGQRDYGYYSHPSFAAAEIQKKGSSPIFKQVRNRAEVGNQVVYNREIRAEMMAYLVKDTDFKVPQEMTNLTGITQELLDNYGKSTDVVDQEIATYYKDKKVLFGAHNTPYDSRILRANAPKTYEVLRDSMIYDSAIFCKENKLAYDEVKLANFEEIEGLSKSIGFYNNLSSDFNLTQFITDRKEGYYPDRTGQKLLSFEDGSFYLIDKEKHESVKLQATGEELLAQLRTNSIPNTAVKYSVEKLSEQWMTHSLLISDEPFDIQYVSLDAPKHANLKPYEDSLIYFQDNYLFDASPEANLEHFIFSHFEHNDAEAASLELDEFLKDFLELNKDIQSKFSDSWMYKRVLEIKDPTRLEVTNDLVDLVNFQTNLPKEKIRKIFADSIRFKEKYKIDHILQHEGHVNGPWDGDKKGDIAFEDKLTLSLLARRKYDPYASDLSETLEHFNQASLKAKLAFDTSHYFSDASAHDSYSYRQGLLYNRTTQSDMISKIQDKESKLGDDSEHVVKFKLGNDVLPAETAICAIVRKGVTLERTDIVRDAKMLDFILVNEQTRESLDNVENGVTRLNLQCVLDANDEQSLKYKEDLSKRYRFMEVNRRDGQLKKILEIMIDCVTGKKVKVPKVDKLNFLSVGDVDIVEKIVDGYLHTMNKGKYKADSEDVEIAKDYLNQLRKDLLPTRLEAALADPTASFKSATSVRDINFINKVDFKRQKPIANLLSKYPSLRLTNHLVQANLKEVLMQEEEQLMKPRSRLI